MVTGTTASGFAYEIDDNVGDDYEVLELMAKVRKNDTFAIFELIEKILGPEQKDRLKDHCRQPNGRVPISKINDEVVEILTAQKDLKKS